MIALRIALNIRTKTFLLTAFLLTSIVGSSSLMLIQVQERNHLQDLEKTREALRQQLYSRAELLSSSVRSFVEQALLENQFDLIAGELAALRQGQRGIRYGILMNNDAKAMVHPNPLFVTTTLTDKRARWAAQQPSFATLEYDGPTEPLLEVAVPVTEAAIDPETNRDIRVRRGTLRLGFSMAELERALAEAEKRHEAQVRGSWTLAAQLTAGALLVGLLLAYFIGGRVTAPIRQLTTDAEAIAQGNLDTPIRPGPRDEIGRLAASFEEMRRGIRDLIERTAEKARMEAELATARDVQTALMPTSPPTSEAFDVAAWYEPASETGGDWYAYLEDETGRLMIAVGDVTGHGAAAALVAAAARTVCSVLAHAASAGLLGRPLTPALILEVLNEELLSIEGAGHMMTCVAVALDPEAGRAIFANAAYNKPLLLRESGDVVVVTQGGPMLGERHDATYEQSELSIGALDTLLLYTDGLIENRNESGREWGRRRLVHGLRDAVAQPTAAEARTTLHGAAARFFGGVPLDDDITFVVVRARAGR